MTSKQRAYLKKLASTLPAIFQVGKNGVTDVFVRELRLAIDARELVKIHILETGVADVRSAAEELATRTDSEIVQVLGSKVILFRKKAEKSKIDLPETS